MQDDNDVGAPQPSHRRSLGLNFDMADAQKRLMHGVSALLNDVTADDFKCEPAEAALHGLHHQTSTFRQQLADTRGNVPTRVQE